MPFSWLAGWQYGRQPDMEERLPSWLPINCTSKTAPFHPEIWLKSRSLKSSHPSSEQGHSYHHCFLTRPAWQSNVHSKGFNKAQER